MLITTITITYSSNNIQRELAAASMAFWRYGHNISALDNTVAKTIHVGACGQECDCHLHISVRKGGGPSTD
jgi:hypothetical protein